MWWPTKPLFPHPLGFSQPMVYFLPPAPLPVCQLSSVSLWEANLSAFPMMCLGKSVSRATGVPNTLPEAPRWCVLCLHFSYLCEDAGCSKTDKDESSRKKENIT